MQNINVFKLLEYELGPRTAAVLLIADSGVAHTPDIRRILRGTSRALLWIEVKRLQDRGWIDTFDGKGRSKKIALTKKGQEIVKDLRQ